MELTQEYLKECFDYRDGFLYWKINRSHMKIGDKAGYLNIKRKSGDRQMLKINRKLNQASRLIFLWHHGYLPEVIDHIDHDTTNDRIENLRACNQSENSKNKKSQKNSYSKYLGVSLYPKLNKWTCQIFTNNKAIWLGMFKTETEAALAYNKAAVKYHGEFANLNVIKPC